ncbi:hypothetical protein [Vibrio sp. 1640]|uniref:O-antigen ligase family protein n=1 Tax=Vibrio sp. 1640 TaxID=3074570 RepID=UPI002964A2C1|nr:hypothetical protein [Vibrio sp. 1640]MDW2080737.1 hypothetical protein [Vibrio sp. 1640]
MALIYRVFLGFELIQVAILSLLIPKMSILSLIPTRYNFNNTSLKINILLMFSLSVSLSSAYYANNLPDNFTVIYVFLLFIGFLKGANLSIRNEGTVLLAISLFVTVYFAACTFLAVTTLPEYIFYGQRRVLSPYPFDGVNLIPVTHFSAIISILIAALITTYGSKKYYVTVVCLVVFLSLSVYAQTRTPLYTLLLIQPMLFSRLYFINKAKFKKRAFMILSLMPLIILIFYLFVAQYDNESLGRLSKGLESPRFELWMQGAKELVSNPFGNDYAVPFAKGEYYGTFHNTFLDFGRRLGIIPAISILCLFITLIIQSISRRDFCAFVFLISLLINLTLEPVFESHSIIAILLMFVSGYLTRNKKWS